MTFKDRHLISLLLLLILASVGCKTEVKTAPTPSPKVDEVKEEPLIEVPTVAEPTPVEWAQLPDGFVDLRAFIPNLQIELRYFSTDNFVGDTVHGYIEDRAILGEEAAIALRNVQTELESKGYGLKLFDGYRPQQAVDHFVVWSKDPTDTLTKAKYYPTLQKNHLFRLGYIARKSSHSRGSAVDVTIVYLEPEGLGNELDMGTPWDLFDEASWTKSPAVTAEQSANRELLRLTMVKNGFSSLPQEWWHFRLKNEPHPETYFDFEVR